MAIAESFKVLSEPVRRRILELLKEGRKSAGELARTLEISPAALSYHLRLLRGAGLIMEYKEKNFVYYSLDMTVLDEMVMWFKSFTDDKFESETFKLPISGSTASNACCMQGYKNDDVNHGTVKKCES